jgi:hypothetical protein
VTSPFSSKTQLLAYIRPIFDSIQFKLQMFSLAAPFKRASIAAELKSENEVLTAFCDKIIQMSEDFDLDGISKLANELSSND